MRTHVSTRRGDWRLLGRSPSRSATPMPERNRARLFPDSGGCQATGSEKPFQRNPVKCCEIPVHFRHAFYCWCHSHASSANVWEVLICSCCQFDLLSDPNDVTSIKFSFYVVSSFSFSNIVHVGDGGKMWREQSIAFWTVCLKNINPER